MQTVSVAVKTITIGMVKAVQVSWRGVSVIGETEAHALAAFQANTGMLPKPRKSK